MEEAEDYIGGIELSERMYKRVEWLLNAYNGIKSLLIFLKARLK